MLFDTHTHTHTQSHTYEKMDTMHKFCMVGELGNRLRFPLTSRSGVGRLWPRSQTLPTACFYKVLLKHSQLLNCLYTVYGCFLIKMEDFSISDSHSGLQSWKYLLAGPLQKKFADSCSTPCRKGCWKSPSLFSYEIHSRPPPHVHQLFRDLFLPNERS